MPAADVRCPTTLAPPQPATAAGCRRAWALTLLLLAQVVYGQSPQPFPAPDLDLWQAGAVFAVEPDGSGGYYVAGSFTQLARQPRASIGQVLADGSLNPAFAPTVGGEVHSLVRLSDGSLLVGGQFSQINGLGRANLARLDASGNLVDSWTPTTNGRVDRLHLDASGTLYVGGDFTVIGGVVRTRLARLDVESGVVDPAWAPSANSAVEAIAVTSDNRVWIGGSFTFLNGVSANRLARLDAAGAIDLVLSANATVNQLQVDAADNVYACGLFTTINTVSRPQLIRINPAGAVQSWGPATNASITDCELDADGLYLTGRFSQVGSAPRQGVARLLPGGTLDPAFVLSTRGPYGGTMLESNNVVIARTGPDQVVVGGFLTFANGQPRAGVVAANAVDGSLRPALDAERPAVVRAIARFPQGWLVGGDFQRAGDMVREHLLRLDSAGQLDPDWVVDVNGSVLALAADVSGPAVYVGGSFSRAGAAARLNLLKLGDAGLAVVDAAWAPNANGAVLAIQPDRLGPDRLYVGGGFTVIAGQGRGRMARLSTLGAGAADAYNPNFNSQVNAIAQPGSSFDIHVGGLFSQAAGVARNRLAVFGTGSTAELSPVTLDANGAVWTLAPTGISDIVVGGDFTSIGSFNRSRLARISNDAVDPQWQPASNGAVLALQADGAGALYVGGGFTQLGGQPRGGIGKVLLDAGGTLDPDFRPDSNVAVAALTVDADGLTAGGFFTQIGGQVRRALARMPFSGTPPVTDGIFINGFEPGGVQAVPAGGQWRHAPDCGIGPLRARVPDQVARRPETAACSTDD